MKASFALLCIYSGAVVFAQTPSEYVRTWGTLAPVASPTRVVEAQAKLQGALTVMVKMVDVSPSADFWREHLHFAALKAELRRSSANVATLDRVYRALFSDKPGMEYPQVDALRRAVHELRDASEFAAMSEPVAEYRRVIQVVAAVMPVYEQKLRAADRIVLGRKIGWLDRSQFAPDLVAYLHRRYCGANELVQFNASLVDKYARKPTVENKQKTYQIQGVATPTTSQVRGQTFLRLIPSEFSAEVEVGMTGTASSQSSGHVFQQRTHVNVSTRSESNVSVSKRVSITGTSPDHVRVGRTIANATTTASNTTIAVAAVPRLPGLPRALQSGCRIRERVAPGIAAQKIPAGQAQGLAIARNELATAADEQKIDAPPEVQNVVDQYQHLAKEFIEYVQRRKGVYPIHQWLSTDTQWFWVKHVRRTETELAGFGTPPEFQKKDHPIGVRVHESEMTNTFNRQLSGEWLTDASMESLNRAVFNDVPPALRRGSHAPRWKIRFADDDPLVVDFENDRVEIDVRFQSTVLGDGDAAKTWKEPVTIRSAYRLTKKKDGPVLERLDETTVFRTDAPDKVLPAELLALVSEKAKAFFRDELYFDGLTPVRGGIFEPLTKFIVDEMRTENQWLLVGGHFDGDLLEILKATPSGLGGNERVIPGK